MQQYPVIDPDTQSLIEGLLRIQEKHIIIKKETVDTLLKQGSFDPAFRTNLENYLNIAQVYYALPKGEYYGAAEPPVRCGESHLSGLTEPPHFVY